MEGKWKAALRHDGRRRRRGGPTGRALCLCRRPVGTGARKDPAAATAATAAAAAATATAVGGGRGGGGWGGGPRSSPETPNLGQPSPRLKPRQVAGRAPGSSAGRARHTQDREDDERATAWRQSKRLQLDTRVIQIDLQMVTLRSLSWGFVSSALALQ